MRLPTAAREQGKKTLLLVLCLRHASPEISQHIESGLVKTQAESS